MPGCSSAVEAHFLSAAAELPLLLRGRRGRLVVILGVLRVRSLVAEDAKGHVGREEAGEDEAEGEDLIIMVVSEFDSKETME
jgi:hypothetical protein